MAEVEQDRGEEKREGDRKRHDECTAKVAEEQEKYDNHQGDALAQVVQDCMRGVTDQVAAVKIRDDLHARRQHVAINVVHLFVQGYQGLFGVGSFAQQHDALNHVIVIYNFAVLARQRFAEFSQPDFCALRNLGDIANADGRAILRLQHGGAHVVNRLHQAHNANVEGLLASFNEASSGVHIIRRQSLLHLGDV